MNYTFYSLARNIFFFVYLFHSVWEISAELKTWWNWSWEMSSVIMTDKSFHLYLESFLLVKFSVVGFFIFVSIFGKGRENHVRKINGKFFPDFFLVLKISFKSLLSSLNLSQTSDKHFFAPNHTLFSPYMLIIWLVSACKQFTRSVTLYPLAQFALNV